LIYNNLARQDIIHHYVIMAGGSVFGWLYIKI